MIRDDTLLQHIREALTRIARYTAAGRDDFTRDEKCQDAVLRNIGIVGEAVKNLSDTLRDSNSDVPWKAIARMRDKLIHHYFGVKLDAVWQVVAVDGPFCRRASRRSSRNSSERRIPVPPPTLPPAQARNPRP